MRGILGGLAHNFEVHQIGLHALASDMEERWTLHPCRIPYDCYGIEELRLLLPKLKPDIVFVLQDLWIIPGYLALLRGCNIPVVAYLPLDGRLTHPEIVEDLREVDHLVTYVPSAYEQLRRAFEQSGTPEGGRTPQLHVIPHAVDVEHFYPVKNAREQLFPHWKDAGDAFVFLNANQNRARKRLDVTIEAFAAFAQGKPANVKLYLHCAPHGYADLRAEAERHGIGARILLTEEEGWEHPVVSEERLNLIYNACDAGVNTSSGEGWGLVSFEHGSTGAAQIVPKHSACGDLWKGAAELVDADLDPPTRQSPLRMSQVSVDGVAEAMERIYADTSLRAMLGAAARLNATSAAYSWPVVGGQWLQLFAEVSTGGKK
jgi:glycosyltransferase involved in cell wall biosynthesis